MEHLLEVKNLSVSIDGPAGEVQAVRDVSFSLKKGEVLAIVGESGCGKSVLCKSIMKLLPPSAKIKEGSICVNGQDITCYREKEMQKLRGRVFSMIFQDPMTSLNPVIRVGKQVEEVLKLHKDLSKEESKKAVIQMFADMGIPEPERRYYSFPHELSGGLRQRVMISAAMICRPDLLIADEPTTALDVTIQEQILKLMKKLVKEHNTSLMLITHDLAVVSQMVDKINVMYCGKLVETGKTEDIIYHNAHPYTEGLLNSIPKLYEDRDRLDYIPGMVPNMFELPEGCYFAPRCKYCQEICRHEKPQMQEVGPGHMAACHFPLLKKKEQEEA